MSRFICVTCGTQFPESSSPPPECPICLDPRQYIGPDGQRWTTREDLSRDHHSRIQELERSLTGISIEPDFGIGQQALLLRTDEGNVLWDSLSFLDNEALQTVDKLGGIRAIAVSHPHLCGSMVDWADRFDSTILIHEADRRHVVRPDSRIDFWSGENRDLFAGVMLVRCGGHFAGSQVLHWPGGADGRGCLLTGDTITVVSDRKWVSFMYSYPNLIPLLPATVKHIREAVEPLQFDRIYGGWTGRVVKTDGHAIVRRSAERYISAIEGRYP